MASAIPTAVAGFADPVLDSQAVFRALLDAMAHPGRIVRLPLAPATLPPLAPATMAILLALADTTTPVWLPQAARTPEITAHLAFHCGCPVTEREDQAAFAVLTDHTTPLRADRFDPGTPEYPDRSATLFVQVARLKAGEGMRLTGPGIETAARLHADPLPEGFAEAMRLNHALFPQGIDVVLVGGDRIAALPRTTRIES
jgi:alpha-D-ribose 1-methylphosphonate 5-triphosphate synthase subunit PhnH